MKEASRVLRAALYGSILILSACGGSGSSNSDNDNGDQGGDGGGTSTTTYSIGGNISGNAADITLSLNGAAQTFTGGDFTFTDEVEDGETYTVLLSASPDGQTCSITNGTGTATMDVTDILVSCEDNQVQADICAPHVTTEHNVIGNNIYEFIAGDGQCFGRPDSASLTKQEIAVTLIDAGNNQDMSMISASNARLTSSLVDTSLIQPSGGYDLGIAIDITNASSQTICGFTNDTASLRSINDEELANISDVEILGDAYFGVSIRNLEYHENCIPAGETRTLWGDALIGHEPLIAGLDQETVTQDDFALLDHITLSVSFDVAEERSDDYFLEALDPVEAVWESQGDNHMITLSFLNMSAHNIYFRRDNVDVIFFDDDGYVIGNVGSEISAFLGVDENDLTDSDYLLTAMGGSISIQDTLLNATLMAGRASKAVIALEICDQATSQSNCAAQF